MNTEDLELVKEEDFHDGDFARDNLSKKILRVVGNGVTSNTIVARSAPGRYTFAVNKSSVTRLLAHVKQYDCLLCSNVLNQSLSDLWLHFSQKHVNHNFGENIITLS